jgi:hypothetical protein
MKKPKLLHFRHIERSTFFYIFGPTNLQAWAQAQAQAICGLSYILPRQLSGLYIYMPFWHIQIIGMRNHVPQENVKKWYIDMKYSK